MAKVSWLQLTIGAAIDIPVLRSILLKVEARRRDNYWKKWLNPVGEFRSVYICSSSRHVWGVSDEFVEFAV